MSESTTASTRSNTQPVRESQNHSRNRNRRQKQSSMQTSSQDVRYNQAPFQQQQEQQQQQQQQQWWPQYGYSDDYYYAEAAYYGRNNAHPRPPRRPKNRQAAPSTTQGNQRTAARPAKQSPVAVSTNETENLRSLLIDQLLRNNYECMICIIKIERDQAIWSCEICYKMFHVNCIQKWARSEESGADTNWRCPGCQYSYSSTPSYTCFCQKRKNPAFQPGDTPHSCGERCGKRLNKKSNDCQHHCPELCHPGPCPTCDTMTKRSCLCGRESRTVMCSSSTTLKCANPCGKLKSCQHHKCELVCHPRECEPCDKLAKQSCSSHGTTREVPCDAETSSKTTYTCGKTCGKILSCGHHRCSKSCHDGPCPECPLLPQHRQTCACGKTNMNNQQRTSCLDPLPTCEKLCEQFLPCGPPDNHHTCVGQCHNGPCPPCEKQMILQCRCGQMQKPTSCTEAVQYDPFKNPFCCERRCNKKKICGKHRCNELCCNRDIHVCEMTCGKTLNCGHHQCEDLCHKNLCRKCPIVSYDELTCRCGQTVMQPPIPCGTPLPACNYQCNRAHACDHPVYHSCHDENECPPCAHLISKLCVGGHTTRESVPCHLKEVLCGQPCGKPLPCGVHKCQRSCHVGECQQPGQKCVQRCAIKRSECPHPCNAPCHGHDPCPLTACHEIIKARCPCGRWEKDIFCNKKPKETAEVKEGVNLTQSLVQALSIRTIDLSLARKQQPNPAQLECDDECRIQQRNRNLAQALSINLDEPRPASVVYTDFLRDYAKKNLEFVQSVERELVQLVDETQRHRVPKRCHSFKPMKKNERHVVHELASFYGLETESVDPEPQRNVVAYATFGVCKVPIVSLSETMNREKLKVPPPVTLM